MLRCDWTAAWAAIMEAARAHGFDRPPPGGAMHRREEEERVAACNTLGLKPQPTHLELRKAYRALALAHHPDKLPPDATDAQREAAAARFNEVQEAHDTLMRIGGLFSSVLDVALISLWVDFLENPDRDVLLNDLRNYDQDRHL